MEESKPLFSESDYAVELRDCTPSDSSSFQEHSDDEESLFRVEISRKGLRCSSKNMFTLSATLAWTWSIAVLLFLIPSFLRKTSPESNSSSSKRNRSQAALDGLRGIACLIVAFFHFFERNYELRFGYIWNPEQPHGGPLASKWNLPVIKIILSGSNMVAIFFVISGYVLSHRFLSQVSQGKVQDAVMSMCSTVFRRFSRLYAPVFIWTVILQILIQMGLFEHGRLHRDGRPYPPRGNTVMDQFWMFWTWWKGASNPFKWNHSYPDEFDGNIWTIPVEYRCSMVLFLVAIGLAKVGPKIRTFFNIVVMGWAVNLGLWEIVLFQLGMLLAEVDVLLAAKKKSEINLDQLERPSKSKKRWLWYPAMFAALYLCSIPLERKNAWGWQILGVLDPFIALNIFCTWQVFGATIMVACALHFGPYTTFLNWAPIQYLGHVSYPLYIVHGTILKLAIYGLKWDIFNFLKIRYQPKDDQGIHMISVWVSFLFFFLPILIIVSDIFTRAIDQPMVAWTRKFWEYCTS